MKRFGLSLVAVLLLLPAACSKKEQPPAATPSAPATATVTPEATASAAPTESPKPPPNHFTVDGAGPYQLGAALTQLQAASQLDEVATGGELCPQNTTARGKGVWADIRVSFRPDGKIYMVVNRSNSIPTPSGATLGMTLAALQSIYGTLGQELSQGSYKAYLVTTVTGRGILFDLDMTSKKVIAMIAGDAAYLKSSYLDGTDYC